VTASGLLHWDGQVWEPVEIGEGGLSSLWGSSDRDIWAAGPAGRLLHFDGESWLRSDPGTRSDILSVGGSSDGDVWILTSFGGILRKHR
jgi:hypothetical protein